MVTHYRGPRPRGWVVSGHLCNLWAYIRARGPVELCPSQDESGCGEYPWPTQTACSGKAGQPHAHARRVSAGPLFGVKGLPPGRGLSGAKVTGPNAGLPADPRPEKETPGAGAVWPRPSITLGADIPSIRSADKDSGPEVLTRAHRGHAPVPWGAHCLSAAPHPTVLAPMGCPPFLMELASW